MKKFIYITLGIIGTIYYLYFQQQNSLPIKIDDILIVGTSADYPPYEKIDLSSGQIVGFDIDVITEVAQRLNKKIKIKDMPFNSLMLNLSAGQIDVVAAGLSATQERKEAVLFSNIYLDSDYMVIITKTTSPALTSVQDLYGKTVAVNAGYNAEIYLSSMPEISLVRLDSTADSALALQADSVDAFATSKSSYTIFIEQQDQKDLYQYFTIPDSAENCAFAFEKNNSNLKENIDLVLKKMKQDGTLENIKTKWGFHD